MSDRIFEEQDLRFDFSNAVAAKKFDPIDRKGSECISAIDFIVELSDNLLFIEVKDPSHPKAKAKDKKKFLEKLQRSIQDNKQNKNIKESLAKELARNCRDAFYYEYVGGRVTKPIIFIAIIELPPTSFNVMSPADDELRKCLFVHEIQESSNHNKVVKECKIMSLATWNSNFSKFPATRISTTKQPTVREKQV
jgi:hypothetical protein